MRTVGARSRFSEDVSLAIFLGLDATLLGDRSLFSAVLGSVLPFRLVFFDLGLTCTTSTGRPRFGLPPPAAPPCAVFPGKMFGTSRFRFNLAC